MLENLADSLNNGFVMAAPYKFYYQQHVSRAAKPLANLSEAIVNIGHLQLLRNSIAVLQLLRKCGRLCILPLSTGSVSPDKTSNK